MPGLRITLVVDEFPVLSQTFVAEEARCLARLGHTVRIESGARASEPGAGEGLPPIAYGEDDGIARKLGALAWLAARHPVRVLEDLTARRRWAREEAVRPLRSLAPVARRVAAREDHHLHAHFAADAALDALRLSRLLGLTYSVATHGYDIFQRPRNLHEKHARAAFATTPCEYTRGYLRQAIGAPHSERIHKLVAGVDPGAFERTRPQPDGRVVIAVARLLEKKGLRHLIEAAAVLQERAPLERVVIVGTGPLEADLRAHAVELGIGGLVDFAGPKEPAEVRELLERSDVLAMPAVVAADGDRDSMPVVVKEALAMEIPVVASDEVGLPELVRPEFGRLVRPADSEALAAALEEILALPVERRAEMGRLGRRWVVEHCNVATETERLGTLIRASRDCERTRASRRAPRP